MSWFKKILGSQSSSQEPKVYYSRNKLTKQNENDYKQKESEKESENKIYSEFEECDDATQSTQGSSCYSWSSVSQQINIRGAKRELSDDKEEPWWESFKSQSTQKSTQESIQMKLFSSQCSSQASDSQVVASYSQGDKSNEEEKYDDEKIRFYLKLGKSKKSKFTQFLILAKMNQENINRINNYIYRYSIKDTAENFNKIAEVITKREFYIYRKILYMINNRCVIEKDSHK